MSNLVEVIVPDIGNFESVDIIEVFVKPGDTIAKEDSLITVESDKASMDIPSSHAGVVKEVKVKVGDKVSKDSVILLVEAEAGASAAPAQTEPSKTETPKAEAAHSLPPRSKISTLCSPSVTLSKPYAIAAAVGSLMIRSTFRP